MPRLITEPREVAEAIGYTFRWMDDWGLSVPHVEYFSAEAYPDGEPETCETAILVDADGHVVNSLSCIDDATDEYRREVENDLAYWVLIGAVSSRY